jgi:hypothetical protein
MRQLRLLCRGCDRIAFSDFVDAPYAALESGRMERAARHDLKEAARYGPGMSFPKCLALASPSVLGRLSSSPFDLPAD